MFVFYCYLLISNKELVLKLLVPVFYALTAVVWYSKMGSIMGFRVGAVCRFLIYIHTINLRFIVVHVHVAKIPEEVGHD